MKADFLWTSLGTVDG